MSQALKKFSGNKSPILNLLRKDRKELTIKSLRSCQSTILISLKRKIFINVLILFSFIECNEFSIASDHASAPVLVVKFSHKVRPARPLCRTDSALLNVRSEVASDYISIPRDVTASHTPLAGRDVTRDVTGAVPQSVGRGERVWVRRVP